MNPRLKAAAGYVLALAALIWVFHDVNPSVIGHQLEHMQIWWLAPAIACDILSYVCEGERWRLLLRPAGHLSLVRAVQAIYAGLFTNEVVPLRFGDLVRVYLVSRWMRQPITAVIPSMAVGRLIDAVWLALGVGVLLQFLPLPSNIAAAGVWFGVLIFVLVAGFIFLAIHPLDFARRWSTSHRSRLFSIMGRLLTGIGDIGFNRNMARATMFSLALVLLQAGAFWFVMIACRIPVGYAAAAGVFMIVHLGTAIPNAPANVGSFQFFTVVGLGLFGVDKSAAAGFSVVVFLVLTLPLWAIGLYSISRSGLTIRQIQMDLSGLRRAA